MGQDVSCLYSKVRNVSGKRATFSFLPPHGRTLEANEELIMFGSVHAAIANRPGRAANRRNIVGFENAVFDGLLIIVHSEGVFLESPNETTKQISMANGGTISAADPCWATATVSESAAN